MEGKMREFFRTLSKGNWNLVLLLLLVVLITNDLSFATVNDEWKTLYDKLETWRTGGLGRGIFIASLIAVAAGVLFSMRVILVPAIAIALILGFGKQILEPLIGTGATFPF
jgi:hypothetical protein